MARHPQRTATAASISMLAAPLGLDAKWLQVLLRESDQTTARVNELLTSAPAPRARTAH